MFIELICKHLPPSRTSNKIFHRNINNNSYTENMTEVIKKEMLVCLGKNISHHHAVGINTLKTK